MIHYKAGVTVWKNSIVGFECLVLSAVDKMFGWPKFTQPSEWTNFPHATLCVWLNERMAKSVGRHDDINNLTQDYRKVKEESRETMAVEVVTDGI